MRLADKVALITGAGSGIGAASARLMVREGARVALVGLPEEGVRQVAAELGTAALPLVCDVSDASRIKAAVEETAAHFGRLDILVANAGIQLHDRDHTLHALDDEVWDRTHQVNYRGVYLTCKHGLARLMAQGQGGVVLIVASVTALSGSSRNVSYMAGKHGLIGLARHIGVHYAAHGIRCNAVCPGALERTPNHDIHPDPQGRAARLSEAIPLGRPGRPEDIAPFIAFLASDEAAYATAATFVVDGGLTMS